MGGDGLVPGQVPVPDRPASSGAFSPPVKQRCAGGLVEVRKALRSSVGAGSQKGTKDCAG